MNTILKTAMVGALALGGSSAFAAIPIPSTGSSDLILVVQNLTTDATYALDTGISINSLLPNSGLVAGASLNDTAFTGITKSIGASTLLGQFLAANPASGDGWALEAGQYNGAVSNGAIEPPGAAKGIFSSESFTASPSNLAGKNLSPTFGAYLGGIGNDIGQNIGGMFALQSATESTAVTYSGTAPKKYNFTSVADFDQLGESSALYGFTGNGNTSKLQTYILGSVVLSATGTLTFSPNAHTAPVPLPAAAWLFGSGLLGLVGVSRRRKAAV
jgi:hypothetical protein